MRYFSIPLLFLTIGCGSMSDRTIHATAFVDHLNNMPSGKSSYLLWHNPNTGNKGDIKVTRSYLVKGIKSRTNPICQTFPGTTLNLKWKKS